MRGGSPRSARAARGIRAEARHIAGVPRRVVQPVGLGEVNAGRDAAPEHERRAGKLGVGRHPEAGVTPLVRQVEHLARERTRPQDVGADDGARRQPPRGLEQVRDVAEAHRDGPGARVGLLDLGDAPSLDRLEHLRQEERQRNLAPRPRRRPGSPLQHLQRARDVAVRLRVGRAAQRVAGGVLEIGARSRGVPALGEVHGELGGDRPRLGAVRAFEPATDLRVEARAPLD